MKKRPGPKELQKIMELVQTNPEFKRQHEQWQKKRIVAQNAIMDIDEALMSMQLPNKTVKDTLLQKRKELEEFLNSNWRKN
ncbi:MAG: hypothetical protein NUV57_03805 [archaeon]|nr:hypothetical protein [archaeon]